MSQWETGSSHVEHGELPEDPVRRELREVTGREMDIVAPADTLHFYRGAVRENAVRT